MLLFFSFTYRTIYGQDDETNANESINEGQYSVNYVFYLDGAGNLPEEVMSLLPKTEEGFNNGETVYAPKLVEEKIGTFIFAGWEPDCYVIEDRDVTFSGIWINTAKALLFANQANGNSSGFSADTWGVLAPGYRGTHNLLLNGQQAYCIEPSAPMPPAGTSYADSGSDSSKLARIIVNGTLNGMSAGAIQATVWNYVKGQKDWATVTSNECVDWDDPVYSGGSCWIDLYSTNGYQTIATYGGKDLEVNGGKIIINKTSKTVSTYSMQGAVYGIYSDKECTALLTKAVIGSDNKASVSLTNNGTFYVKEISAPKGYIVDSKTYPVNISGGNSQTVDSVEDLSDGILIIKKTKIGESNNSLAGAIYGIYSDSSCLKKVKSLTIDENNEAKTSLYPGKYYIKEEKAPKGYELDENIYEAQIQSETSLTITSKEKVSDGTLLLIKESKNNYNLLFPNNYSLANAEYGIYTDASCSDLLKKITTDNSAKAKIALKPGTYYLKELKASKGYKLDDTVYKFIIEPQANKTLTSKEEAISKIFDIEIIKENARDNNISNFDEAEFTLNYYDQTTDDITNLNPDYTWIFKPLIENNRAILCLDLNHYVSGNKSFFNEDGILMLPLGTFSLQESKAPSDFAIDPNFYIGHIFEKEAQVLIEFNIPDNSWIKKTDDSHFVQEEKPQSITLLLKKNDIETGDNPQGFGNFKDAYFEINKLNTESNQKEYITTAISDENGKVIIKEDDSGKSLLPGTYFIKEIKAPKGYALNSEEYVIEALVKEENVANFDYDLTISDKVSELIVSKKDSDNNCLPGALLQLLDENDEVIYSWTSKSEPEIIKGLDINKQYTIREAATPDDHVYQLAKDINVSFKDEKPVEIDIIDGIINIHTFAYFQDNGKKNHEAFDEAIIVDNVQYEYLNPDNQYILKAQLYDKTDNQILMEKQNIFNPKQSKGEELIEFKINLNDYDEHDFVVFEKLYLKNDKEQLLIDHSDINDQDQTVHIDKLYRADLILYKSNSDRSIKLDGALFSVDYQKEREDGKTIKIDLGKYLSGGIYIENDDDFTYELSNNDNMLDIIDTYDAIYDASINKYTVSILGLDAGNYYGRIVGDNKINKHMIEKGMIFLEKLPKDAKVCFMELKAPKGYYPDNSPYIIDIGHNTSINVLENYRTNNAIIIPFTPPKTGVD